MNIRIPILLLTVLFLLSSLHKAHAQNYPQQASGILLYNVGSGMLIGGVGALINKDKGQDPWKTFLRGASRGAIGGAINYGSKQITAQIARQENYVYGWPGRLTQSLGTSMIENAAANRSLLASYHFSYGPLRLELDAQTQYKPSLKLKPIALVGLVWLGSKGTFSAKHSLLSGAPVFISDGPINMFGGSYGGYALGIVTALDKAYIDNYELFAHEFIHIHQYEDYIGVNSFFDRPLGNLKNNSSSFNTLSKYVYLDIHAPLLLGTYFLLHDGGNYFKNWFEFEAEHFATWRTVSR